MNSFFDMSVGDIRECSIKITSRHYLRDIDRFVGHITPPSLFGKNAGADAAGITDPEDFPEEMSDALDEILTLENKKFGAPLMVNDPYAPAEEDDMTDDYPDDDDDAPFTREELKSRIDRLMQLLFPDEADSDAIIFETRGTIERCIRDGRSVIEVKYIEDESMDDTETVVRFDPSRPRSALISHAGSVVSTLILEEGVRHITVYETPIMPFEIAVYTKKCRGGFTVDGGTLSLDYLLELRGADLQRTVMTIEATSLSGS